MRTTGHDRPHDHLWTDAGQLPSRRIDRLGTAASGALSITTPAADHRHPATSGSSGSHSVDQRAADVLVPSRLLGDLDCTAGLAAAGGARRVAGGAPDLARIS